MDNGAPTFSILDIEHQVRSLRVSNSINSLFKVCMRHDGG
jgi:hypothetical protein